MRQDILFIKDSCPFCHQYLNWIDIVSSRLPPGRIKIVNASNFMEMEIIDDLLIEKFKIEEVPCFFLSDGEGYRKICGTSSRDWIKGFLFAYYEGEFIR